MALLTEEGAGMEEDREEERGRRYYFTPALLNIDEGIPLFVNYWRFIVQRIYEM